MNAIDPYVIFSSIGLVIALIIFLIAYPSIREMEKKSPKTRR